MGARALPATLETVALAVHLQDVDMVGETVQQRSGQAFRPEDPGPLVEREVGGHQDGAPLVALAKDLKEEFRPGGGQGHEAQVVDDEQVKTGQLPLQVEQPPLIPSITTSVQGGMWGDTRMAARRLAWERLARSLLSCVSSSHRSNSSGPNRSRGSISRTTR